MSSSFINAVGSTTRGETRQFLFYALSSGLFVVSLVTFSLPWSHWAYTVNTCPGHDCECVLYGKSFSDQFSGGEAIYCQLITFLQIPLFLTASGLSFYQGKTALMVKRKERQRIAHQGRKTKRNSILVLRSRSGRVIEEGDVLVEEIELESEPPSYRCCVALVVTSGIFLLFLTAISILYLIGFFGSCNQYRKMLVKLLKASGNMAQIFTERLDCAAVFNFMDYLQPKRNLYDPYDYERKYKINTGVSLLLSQMSLLANLFLWIRITLFNVKALKRRKRFGRKH